MSQALLPRLDSSYTHTSLKDLIGFLMTLNLMDYMV